MPMRKCIGHKKGIYKKAGMAVLFLLVLLLGLVGYARFIEPERLIVRTFDVKVKKAVSPCRIIFFTDTHFGKLYDVSHMEDIVEKINQRQPDIVVFGGDLLDNYARDRDAMDVEYLIRELKKIHSKSGKYAVWGNHDYGGGAVRIYEDLMTRGGFTLLRNESIDIKEYGIHITGYDDFLMGQRDTALHKTKTDLFHLILSHEPIVSTLIENTGENFMLSGHTHGGQITLPFMNRRFLPEGSGKFVKGFYTKEEIGTSTSIQMVTSSGIGLTKVPLRFMNVPEIIEINLSGTQ